MTYYPQLSGTPGGDGQLVFAWNKTNLLQFDGAGPQYSAGTGGNQGADSTLAVVNKTERGNVIRLTPEAAATDMTLIWLASTVVPFEGTRRDMIIELEIDDHSPVANEFMGVAFLCNDMVNAQLGFMHLPACAAGARGAILNNAVTVLGPSDATQVFRAGFHRFLIRGDRPASSNPRIRSWREHWSTSGGNQAARSSGEDATQRGTTFDFGSNTTLDGDWADPNESLNRFGLAYITTGGQNGAQCDILDLRAYLL